MKRRIGLLAFALCAMPGVAQTGRAAYAERFAAVCAACHGEQGRSVTALVPSLAGQPSFYAVTQLFLFRAGRRDSEAMTAVAQGMSDADLRGFADLIGSLPPPPPAPDAPDVDALRVARGQVLAQRLHCGGCHGADFAGGPQVPRIAHQREDYLQLALRGFRAGTRLGYTNAMGEALAGLAPQDLDDLAHFLAHRPAPAQTLSTPR